MLFSLIIPLEVDVISSGTVDENWTEGRVSDG
jgi:hypothetical protein